MIVLPRDVDRRARRPAPRRSPRGPTAAMRLPSTTTVPSSMTSSPFIVTTRPPTSATRPGGHVGVRREADRPRHVAGGFGQLRRARRRRTRRRPAEAAREELRPERPVQAAAVARPVQVLAGVVRRPWLTGSDVGLRPDLDRACRSAAKGVTIGVEALAKASQRPSGETANSVAALAAWHGSRSSLPSSSSETSDALVLVAAARGR